MGKYSSPNFSPFNLPPSSQFKDAVDKEGEDGQKIWVTKSTHNSSLFEFINKTMYREDKPTRTYNLPLPFTVSLFIVFFLLLYGNFSKKSP